MSDWLASRSPRPPRELTECLAKIAGDSSCPADDLSATLLRMGLGVLDRIGDDRRAAPDLLAADALFTYSMEAAAEYGNVEEAAAHAMRAIGSGA